MNDEDRRDPSRDTWIAKLSRAPLSGGLPGVMLILTSCVIALVGGVASAFLVDHYDLSFADEFWVLTYTIPAVLVGIAAFKLLSPTAYRWHCARTSISTVPDKAPTRTRVLRVIGSVAALVVLSVLSFRACTRASVLSALDESWQVCESALRDGDIVRVDRNWRQLHQRADKFEREEPRLADDIAEARARWRASLPPLIQESWPALRDSIEDRRTCERIANSYAIGDIPELRERLAEFREDFRRSGAIADVRITMEGDDADRHRVRNGVLRVLRDHLADVTIVPDWPFTGSAPSGTTTLKIEFVVRSEELSPAPGSRRDTGAIHIPTVAIVDIAVANEAPNWDLPRETMFLGALSVEHPLVKSIRESEERRRKLDGEERASSPLLGDDMARSISWSHDDAINTRDENEGELLRLFAESLGGADE